MKSIIPYIILVSLLLSCQRENSNDNSLGILSKSGFSTSMPIVDCEATGANGSLWTLYTKFGNPHPEAASYTDFTFVGSPVTGTHPTLSFSINGWSVFTACGETQPADDSNGAVWLAGSPDDYPGVTFTRVNPDSPCVTEIQKAVNVKICNPDDINITSTPVGFNETPNGYSQTGTAVTQITDSDVLSFTVCKELGQDVEVSFDGGATWPYKIDRNGCRTWGQGNDQIIDVSNVRFRGQAGATEYDVNWETK